jgi:integrase
MADFFKRTWVDKDGEEQFAWVIRFMLRGVRVYQRAAVNSREKAKEEAAIIREQIRDRTWKKASAAASIPTLKEWKDRVLEAVLEDGSESTSELYDDLFRLHLLPWGGKLRLDDIRPKQIAELKAKLKADGLAFKYRNNILGVLSRALNLAVELEVLEAAPRVQRFRKKKETKEIEKTPRYLTFEQEAELAAYLQANEPEHAPFEAFAAETGLRIGELCALRWEDIDPHAGGNGSIHVCRSVYKGRETLPKGRKPRTLPLTNRARLSLLAQKLLTAGLDSKYVFAATKGKNAGKGKGRHAMQRPFARWAKALGWKVFGPHVLRHTFASHLVMAGVPLRTVQEYLGHSTIRMTERYASLAPKVAQDAILVLDQRRADRG